MAKMDVQGMLRYIVLVTVPQVKNGPIKPLYGSPYQILNPCKLTNLAN
jgi:hypothetical protein